MKKQFISSEITILKLSDIDVLLASNGMGGEILEESGETLYRPSYPGWWD